MHFEQNSEIIHHQIIRKARYKVQMCKVYGEEGRVTGLNNHRKRQESTVKTDKNDVYT